MQKKGFVLFWTIVTSIYTSLFVLEYFYLSQYEAVVLGYNFNQGLSFFLAQTLYTIFSIRVVGATELGARLFFGKPINELTSGLVFIPLWICQLQKETRLTIQDELPADPENIFRNEDTETVPEGMFPPIRIPFGNPKTPSDDPLNVRVTAEVVLIVRWNIRNYITFLTTIGSKKEAVRQMEDSAVAMLISEFAQVTPAAALKRLARYNRKLKKEIESRVKLWGVHIENAQVKGINFHRGLNEAVASIPESTANARATVIKAEAEKIRLTREGQGRGAAERAEIGGRTAAYKKMANDLNLTPPSILAAETARTVGSTQGRTIVLGADGIGDLAKMAAAAGAIFEENSRKSETREITEEENDG